MTEAVPFSPLRLASAIFLRRFLSLRNRFRRVSFERMELFFELFLHLEKRKEAPT